MIGSSCCCGRDAVTPGAAGGASPRRRAGLGPWGQVQRQVGRGPGPPGPRGWWTGRPASRLSRRQALERRPNLPTLNSGLATFAATAQASGSDCRRAQPVAVADSGLPASRAATQRRRLSVQLSNVDRACHCHIGLGKPCRPCPTTNTATPHRTVDQLPPRHLPSTLRR